MSLFTEIGQRDPFCVRVWNSTRPLLRACFQFAPGKYDVIMIDLGMSGMSGDQLLKQIKAIDPVVSTVLITGWDLPDTDTRVSSFDFQVTKPFTDLDEVEDVVARAIALHDERVGEAN